MACYDFPEIVIHDPGMGCGRYQEGGVCRPLPTPVEPYTEEEAEVVKGYEEFMRFTRGETSPSTTWGTIDAPGATLPPSAEGQA